MKFKNLTEYILGDYEEVSKLIFKLIVHFAHFSSYLFKL